MLYLFMNWSAVSWKRLDSSSSPAPSAASRRETVSRISSGRQCAKRAAKVSLKA